MIIWKYVDTLGKYGIFPYICDRICQNPACRENAQVTQCAFLVAQVEYCQNSAFVIFMSKNLSTNCYHCIRRVDVSYQGEINLYLQGIRSTLTQQLPYTKPIANGVPAHGLSRYS